jgi:apolipoprotein D and lipocalin family protein
VPQLKRGVVGLLLLAGCAAAVPDVAGYRRPDVPIYSNAVIAPGDLTGEWTQVAGFATAPGCDGGAVSIVPQGAGLAMRGRLCLGAGLQDASGVYAVTGPGRIRLGTGPEWWVIWADTNLRTLAIGTPDGRFGFILNKGTDLPADRLRAAREVFDFNGYGLARLRTF